MAGTQVYGRNNHKKTYQDRSQPKSWYQQSYSDTEPAEWFDRTHLFKISSEPFMARNPFETYLDFGQYDEDVVLFSGETQKTVTFNVTFDYTPVVVVVNSSTASDSNVNIFVSSPTNTGMVINTSAPFYGQLIYKAIYSITYPIYVRRSPLSSSEIYFAAAGTTNPSSAEFVVNFASLSTLPTTMFLLPVDVSGSGTANVSIVATGSLTTTTLPVSLSAQVVNEVHYLAVVPQ